jgi:hypothetical protein
MLGLLAAAIGTSRLVPLVPRALAAKTPECFALQAFGDWKGTATNKQAGARIGQVTFSDHDADSAPRSRWRRATMRSSKSL